MIAVADPGGRRAHDAYHRFVRDGAWSSWKRRGPERAAALSLWLHAAIWCWYLQTNPAGRTWIPRPWYRHKHTASFLDALAALRRTLWSQRITAMSATTADNHKITSALLDALAYAA
jgi:hypothetical protein